MKEFSNAFNAVENIFLIIKIQIHWKIKGLYLKHWQNWDCYLLMGTELLSWNVLHQIVLTILSCNQVQWNIELKIILKLSFETKHFIWEELTLGSLLDTGNNQSDIIKAKDFFYNYIDNLLKKELTLDSKIWLLQRLMMSSLTWMRMMVVRVESDVNLCQWFLWLQVVTIDWCFHKRYF